jgi:molybdate transport system permease protein
VRRVFTACAVAAAALAVGFLVLPVLALFLRVPPGDLVDALGTRAALDALVVSAKTSAIAHTVVLLVGTPAAYAIGRERFRGRALLLSLIELPLVLPPAVAGIALLVTFGRLGLLGGTLHALGIRIDFT